MIEDQKDAIFKAVIGLVLAFIAWLVLFTINPTLVGLQGPSQSGTGSPQQSGQQPPTPSTGLLTEEEARAILDAGGVTAGGIIVDLDPCPPGATNPDSCTSLAGLPRSTATSLAIIAEDFKQECPSCVIVVSGGTEPGLDTHGQGLPIVDLEFDATLAQFLQENATIYGITSICTAPQDFQFSLNCATDEQTQRLHLVF